MPESTDRPAHHESLIQRLLHASFGDLDAPTPQLLRQRLDWVDVAGGATLIEQDAPRDALYMAVSGRLRAYRRDDSGA